MSIDSWGKSDRRFCSNQADAVAGDFGSIPTSETFANFLLRAELTDENFTVENFAPGSGGQSKFLQMLKGEIGLQDMLKRD